MSAAVSISTRRPYGLVRVCRVWDVSRASVYRGRRMTAPTRAAGSDAGCSPG